MSNNIRQHTFLSRVFGWALRVTGTIEYTLEDGLSVWALMMMGTPIVGVQIAIASAAAMAMGHISWKFWGIAIQKNVMRFGDYLATWSPYYHKPAYSTALMVESQSEKKEQHSLLWFGFIACSSLVTTFALNSFYVRETMKTTFNLKADDPLLIAISISTGACVTVYSACTELLGIWQEEFGDDTEADTKKETTSYVALKFLIVILGSLVMGYQAGLAIYLQMGLLTTSVALRATFALVIGAFQVLQSFFFQGMVLIGDTPAMEYLTQKINQANKPGKIALLAVMGLTTILVSFSGHQIAMQELLEEIFVGRWDFGVMIPCLQIFNAVMVIQILSIASGIFGMCSEMFSEYTETVDQLMADESDVELEKSQSVEMQALKSINLPALPVLEPLAPVPSMAMS